MKNNVINTLKYTGIVTLSQYIGKNKIKIAQTHNEGGESLFNFLIDCLIGDFDIASNNRPNKVMLLQKSDENNSNSQYRQADWGVGFIGLLTKPEKVYSVDNVKVRYSFVIPKELVNNITDYNNLYLGLYTANTSMLNPNDFAAICELKGLGNAGITAAVIVDWELMFSNMITNKVEGD
jgi:hypothetical protein